MILLLLLLEEGCSPILSRARCSWETIFIHSLLAAVFWWKWRFVHKVRNFSILPHFGVTEVGCTWWLIWRINRLYGMFIRLKVLVLLSMDFQFFWGKLAFCILKSRTSVLVQVHIRPLLVLSHYVLLSNYGCIEGILRIKCVRQVIITVFIVRGWLRVYVVKSKSFINRDVLLMMPNAPNSLKRALDSLHWSSSLVSHFLRLLHCGLL